MLCHLGIIVYISQRYTQWAHFLFYAPLPFGIPPSFPPDPRRMLTVMPLDVSGFGIGPFWQRAVATSNTPFRWDSLSRGWHSARRFINPHSGGPPRLPTLLMHATPIIPSPQPAHIARSARQLTRKPVHPFSDQLYHSPSFPDRSRFSSASSLTLPTQGQNVLPQPDHTVAPPCSEESFIDRMPSASSALESQNVSAESLSS